MTIAARLVFTISVLTLLVCLVIGTVTVMLFPPESIGILWSTAVFGIPYLLFAGGTAVLFVLFSGLAVHAYWKEYNKQLQTRLDKALLGTDGAETAVHKQEVFRKIAELQEKLARQTQRTRQAAAEKAADREKSLQEVIVQERTRLARELHDSVSQQLFAASMLAAAINESEEYSGAVKEQFQLVERMINQSQLEMRALLLHLRPAALKDKSLKAGMEELLGELKQKVPVNVESRLEEVALDKGVEDHLFRILQEAVSNSLRHASAGEVSVTLMERDGKVIMQVVDDGKGFRVQEEAHGSYGMSTMKERAEEVGGRLKVVSVPGEGTRVEVQIPIWKDGENK
jgi:two-component system, NarL family, sensor histidine kinase LiaS